MELQISKLSHVLNTLDSNPSNQELLSQFALAEISFYLIKNLQSSHIKLLRQLLIHAESTIIEIFLIDPSSQEQILRFIAQTELDYDSTKLFVEIFDGSLHSGIVTSEFIERVVDGLGDADERTCENLVKVLILVAEENMEFILSTKNSRFFGESLVFRVNWASGTEKRNLIKTIGLVLQVTPDFFYLNDLKLLVDTLIKVLVDREVEVLKETYEILQQIVKNDEFCKTRYRFEELGEILQHSEDDFKICEIQYAILSILEGS